MMNGSTRSVDNDGKAKGALLDEGIGMEDEDMLIPLKLNGLTKNKKEEMRECNSVQRPSAYASAFTISFVTSIVFSLVSKSPQELHALVYTRRSASERSISQAGPEHDVAESTWTTFPGKWKNQTHRTYIKRR